MCAQSGLGVSSNMGYKTAGVPFSLPSKPRYRKRPAFKTQIQKKTSPSKHIHRKMIPFGFCRMFRMRGWFLLRQLRVFRDHRCHGPAVQTSCTRPMVRASCLVHCLRHQNRFASCRHMSSLVCVCRCLLACSEPPLFFEHTYSVTSQVHV